MKLSIICNEVREFPVRLDAHTWKHSDGTLQQPDTVEDVPAYCKGIELDDLHKSLPMQFYDFINVLLT